MTTQPECGELLVGSYLKLVADCELVTYNQRSKEQGEQMEIDVIGVDTTPEGEQIVYTCEVVTHLNGLHYSGSPKTKRWKEFGNDNFQHTLERIWRKFNSDIEYVTELFDSADSYVFQLWSPVVPVGHRTNGLAKLAEDFADETGAELELVINEHYTERIDELREVAASTEKNHGELGFRLLQILEHLRSGIKSC